MPTDLTKRGVVRKATRGLQPEELQDLPIVTPQQNRRPKQVTHDNLVQSAKVTLEIMGDEVEPPRSKKGERRQVRNEHGTIVLRGGAVEILMTKGRRDSMLDALKRMKSSPYFCASNKKPSLVQLYNYPTSSPICLIVERGDLSDHLKFYNALAGGPTIYFFVLDHVQHPGAPVAHEAARLLMVAMYKNIYTWPSECGVIIDDDVLWGMRVNKPGTLDRLARYRYNVGRFIKLGANILKKHPDMHLVAPESSHNAGKSRHTYQFRMGFQPESCLVMRVVPPPSKDGEPCFVPGVLMRSDIHVIRKFCSKRKGNDACKRLNFLLKQGEDYSYARQLAVPYGRKSATFVANFIVLRKTQAGANNTEAGKPARAFKDLHYADKLLTLVQKLMRDP